MDQHTTTLIIPAGSVDLGWLNGQDAYAVVVSTVRAMPWTDGDAVVIVGDLDSVTECAREAHDRAQTGHVDA